VIGKDNGLPWRLSSDLKRFKALTLGKPVVMGRKCFDSIGKPLAGRTNIVITRNKAFSPEGVVVAHSLAEALDIARSQAEKDGVDEIAIIGGGEIYRESMESADLLYVTHILTKVEGDTWFPPIDPAIWREKTSESVAAGEKDDFPTRFVIYEHRPAG
jgi:dihydrofolate reductase